MTQPSDMFGDGAAYERMMGRWSRRVGAQFLKWIEVPSGKSWLDVGCGNGAFTEDIVASAKPFSVTGVDPSAAQLAYASKRPALTGAEFHVGDAQSLPVGDGTFDAAVMALVISFVPDPHKGAEELARVVKPGGTVASYMWDMANLCVPLSPLYRALTTLEHPAPPPPSAHASSLDAMQSMWTAAGLTSVTTTRFRIDTAFNDFADFWESCFVSVGPLGKVLMGLSPTEVKDLQAELHATLPFQANGSIVYDSVANAVKGQKPTVKV
jgi:ubiquinone/menaquinone biosynthesis C-methylase UbiE